MAKGMSVNQPKAPGESAIIKASRYDDNQGINRSKISKFSMHFDKDLQSK